MLNTSKSKHLKVTEKIVTQFDIIAAVVADYTHVSNNVNK